MENYTLSEKEVVLYKGKISFEDKNENTELILTNINLVFIRLFIFTNRCSKINTNYIFF